MPTVASASDSEPDAGICRVGSFPVHSGISTGTSIDPAPWALDIMKDQSVSPAFPAGNSRPFPTVRHVTDRDGDKQSARQDWVQPVKRADPCD